MNEWLEDGYDYLRDKMLDSIAEVGRIAMLVGDTFRKLGRGLRSFGLIVDQMDHIGVQSLMLVFIVSLFTGAVAAVQAGYQFANVVPLKFIGSVILRSVIIELGPVLTALIVGGRVGASIAAELGTMRVTEQIDALEVLATDPVHFLVVPRVWATVLMLPLLIVVADVIGIAGGYLVSVVYFGANPVTYMENTFIFMDLADVNSGLIKAAVFGLIISVVGCQKGFFTRGGAEGVGRATTRAVVLASIAILISDFFLTKILF